jgi:hypothetical protein
MHTQWASYGITKEAVLKPILFREYLESIYLAIESLDGDANTECDVVNENPTQGGRKRFRGKYPEMTTAPALFEQRFDAILLQVVLYGGKMRESVGVVCINSDPFAR